MWQESVDVIVYKWFGMHHGEKLAEALDFFLYDSVKIIVLLCVIVFVVTFLRSYISAEYVREYLAKRHPLVGYIAAAFFGIITPFCSCSAIPLFLGFLQARIPLGVTFSYLISAPMNNEVAIAMLFMLFGWKIAALYIGCGLIVAIFGGIIIGKMKLENEILITLPPQNDVNTVHSVIKLPLVARVRDANMYTIDIVKKIWIYIMLGVSVGAFIHGYVPADFIVRVAGKDSLFAVPIATLLGVPMYSNAAGVMPLIEVLTAKGMLMGTALSFMMAITALSLPEAIILKRIMSVKLIAFFFGTVAIGIMGVGYVFNALLG